MEFATWPDDFFTKPVCKFGLISIIIPQLWYFCKAGQGHFLQFFLAEPIFAKGTKPKINIFLRQNNTLDQELIISANN